VVGVGPYLLVEVPRPAQGAGAVGGAGLATAEGNAVGLALLEPRRVPPVRVVVDPTAVELQGGDACCDDVIC